MTNDLRSQLQSSLHGRVGFIGLGNLQGGDDAFGVRLAEALLRAGLPDVMVAGAEPEAMVSRCLDARLDHLVFLDAADFGAAPGSAVFLDSSQMSARFPQISTHHISLGTLAKCVESSGTTRAWLLGVQPASLQPSAGLSPAIRAALAVLTVAITGVIQAEAQPA